MNLRNFTFLGLAYFAVLFNYPLIRASSTTFFVEEFGAKSSPQGWLVAVIILIFSVMLSNRLQSKVGFHRTFVSLSCATVLFFTLSYWAYRQDFSWGAFAAFSIKEVYIVLQVHLLLAYANAWLKREDFVKWIGPLGALGSVGGILGGLLTTELAKRFGTGATFLIGQIFVLMAAICAAQLDRVSGASESKQEVSPLMSIQGKDLRIYVLSIAGIVALTQIIINIADFQFSLVFEAAIKDPSERTSYLGSVYAATNAVTLGLQLVVLPLVLSYLGERTLHFFIPLSYLLCLAFGLNSGVLMASAIFYTYLKASDYSLFSAGKELLYHPMQPLQKYGAKYLTDMFVYRAAKAGIAAVLIYFQSPGMLLAMMITALVFWLVLVVVIFHFNRRLFH